jgi:molybdenum cofactor cytidylyltransferase
MTCAIVLAAGKSERMGTQKLLLPYAGSTMIARVVDAFLSAPVDSVCVVVRPSGEPIRAALAGRPVIFVENPDPKGDMLSSVRAGIRALPGNSEILLVAPGDQPAITPLLIREMLEYLMRKCSFPFAVGAGDTRCCSAPNSGSKSWRNSKTPGFAACFRPILPP